MRQPLERRYVSTLTVAAIRRGLELQTDAGARESLPRWLTHEVRPVFARGVLPVDEDVILMSRLLLAGGRRNGHTYSKPDLLIVATGLHPGLTVVSRDGADDGRARVALPSPGTSASGRPHA